MKAKFVSLLVALCSVVGALGDGQIMFSNLALHRPSGEVYYVPIWLDMNGNGTLDPGEGIGSYAAALGETATLGLYLPDNPTPIATAQFRSDIHGEFVGKPSLQTVEIPGHAPGEQATLIVKAWIGASYDSASIRGSWTFTSQPLGGTPIDGVPIVPPTMAPWGDTATAGFKLTPPPLPIAATDTLLHPTYVDGRIAIQALLANDNDPSGGIVTFVSADTTSKGGSAISVVAGDIIYRASDSPAPDSFFYTIRNSSGGVARGRVDVIAYDPEGMILFRNHNIPKADGNGFYDVPIYVDANSDSVASVDEAIGRFAAQYYGEPAKLALFLRGSDVPLATAAFRADGAVPFLEPSSQLLTVPNVAPGSQVDLTIKAWIGASFDTARVKGSWDISSLPLGGGLASGQYFSVPGLAGWGDAATSVGYSLSAGPKPIATTDEVVRRYRQDAIITADTLLANDTDPDGGALTIIAVDALSNGGSVVMLSGSTITYKHNVEADDYFSYTVRGSHGATSKGRVNVKASDPIGEIIFSNQNIPKTSGDGTYNVPIWIDYNTNGVFDFAEGVGSFAALFGKSATLGLYLQGTNEPIVTAAFGDGFLAHAGGTNVVVPGFRPGESAPLTIKVWVGNDFDSATLKKSWDFTSLPLGGPRAGDTTVATPGLTGWGDENGHGYALEGAGPLPVAGTDTIHIPIGGIIPIGILLTNDFVPGGGVLTAVLFDHTSQNGNPILFFNDAVSIPTATVGTDAFNYSVISSGGVVGAGHVDVTLNPCNDCGGTGGGGPGGVSPARIYFSNRLVRRSNTSGAYNIPIWVDANFNGRRDPGEGIGSFANQSGDTATLGLFLRNGTSPIATARFYADARGSFLEDPEIQTVDIPGGTAGSPAQLTLKAWIGPDFATAAVKATWDFDSLPLGGFDQFLGTPDLSGWGDEINSSGYGITPGVKPKTYGQVLTRASGQNVNTKIADMMKNDSDPEGGALTFVSVDDFSREGAVITVLGNTVYYIAALKDSDMPDYFEYTVRNSKGGVAKGRVDVVVTDAQGQFNARLDIQSLPYENQISFRGIVGTNYLVQFRDGVNAPWQDLGLAVHEAFGLFKITDATGNSGPFVIGLNDNPVRLYRVITQP